MLRLTHRAMGLFILRLHTYVLRQFVPICLTPPIPTPPHASHTPAGGSPSPSSPSNLEGKEMIKQSQSNLFQKIEGGR